MDTSLHQQVPAKVGNLESFVGVLFDNMLQVFHQLAEFIATRPAKVKLGKVVQRFSYQRAYPTQS